MDFTPTFISNVQDAHKEVGTAWIKALPSTITKVCDIHGCRLIKPMPDLTYHFVGLVEIMATNEKAVLKMAPISDNVAREAKWLSCYDKDVAKVYWFDDEHHAYLMEHLVPGKSLKYSVRENDDQATRIICHIIHHLNTYQHPIEGFTHLSELAIALPILKGKIDDHLLTKAQTLFADLTQDKSKDVLLHGDLHHDNVLSCGDEWKVIDPHGYVGDPAFASSTMIYNPGSEYFPNDKSLSKVIERRLAIVSEILPYDPSRIKAWAFCMTMLSIAWTMEDSNQVPEFKLSVAKIIDAI